MNSFTKIKEREPYLYIISLIYSSINCVTILQVYICRPNHGKFIQRSAPITALKLNRNVRKVTLNRVLSFYHLFLFHIRWWMKMEICWVGIKYNNYRLPWHDCLILHIISNFLCNTKNFQETEARRKTWTTVF